VPKRDCCLNSQNVRDIAELESRTARARRAVVGVTDVDQKVRAVASVGKELPVDGVRIEFRHRTDGQPERPCSDEQIRSLQCAVSKRRRLGKPGVAGEEFVNS
jgi:hypothetical protein